ncbi:microsomal epoxide hydrolase [Sporothrix brasiliensis 5110]|uniref:Microsomal epoxide hydrolase n=1 Tax=Sporothrix brasiliensis 5110 TaxID=1398154 RepID=A0A0C2IUL5_9PEZI|nr:microsomal epoxide hydrolase [Sporothrix brasiliensis 5110]KIH92846.1 microsomal epoxide hydrolase [Sporothrix brasiliensis 5110]
MAIDGFGGFGNLPTGASDAIKPWKVHIPQASLDNLKALLKVTPLAPQTYENSLPNKQRTLGVRHDWISATKQHWETDFDWREQEAYINSFPHFRAQIEDGELGHFDLHFVGLFSQRSDAIPILLLHGWPGCFVEFLGILDGVRARYKPDTLPYHLVVPSLPGYTLSSPPPIDKNIDSDGAARILHGLTVELGFDKYMIQGGDLGGRIGRVVAANYAACKAIHLNTGPMPPPEPAALASEITETEQAGLDRHALFRETGSAYAYAHATRPATMGFVLSSSPVALLAWIGEKYMDWTDADPPVDDILTCITLYWVTNCAATSLWSYRQFYGPGAESHGTKRWHIHKPLGFSWFPKEITPVPKAWVETTGQLVFYRQHDRGGHFAAFEQPDRLWQDVEDFIDIVKDEFRPSAT